MANYPYKNEGIALLRIVLGFFFLITGLMKLTNPPAISGLLAQIGFSAPVFWGWVVLLAEIIFGILVLVGWRTEISVWPLIIILTVAIIKVYVPLLGADPMAAISILFHLSTIAAFIALALTGPGRFAVTGWTRRR